MKWILLVLIFFSREYSQKCEIINLEYTKNYIINKEIENFAIPIYDFCLYFESFFQTEYSICNIIYQYFFFLKFPFTSKILSIDQLKPSSKTQSLNFKKNGNTLISNYRNEEITFITKQEILRNKKTDVLSLIKKIVLNYLSIFGYDEVTCIKTDDDHKAIQLFEVVINILKTCLNKKESSSCIKDSLQKSINDIKYGNRVKRLFISSNLPTAFNNDENENIDELNLLIKDELEKTLKYNSLFLNNKVNLKNNDSSNTESNWCKSILSWLGLSNYDYLC